MKSLMMIPLMGMSLAGVLTIGNTSPAAAETLVTCGPNGAAYIVNIVPAGCRLLAATSAPKHPPTNVVQESRLGFTFNAAKPGEALIAETTTNMAEVEESSPVSTSYALW